MNYTYTINPCKACQEKLKNDRDCNINSLNNCCTEIASHFSGYPSNEVMSNVSIKNWKDCMESTMKKQGRDFCNLRLNVAPVFAQVPHFFPKLLYEGNTPDIALKKCKTMCEASEKMTPNECIEACQVDYNAVEMISKGDNVGNIYKKKDSVNTVNTNKNNRGGGGEVFMVLVLILIILIASIRFINDLSNLMHSDKFTIRPYNRSFNYRQ